MKKISILLFLFSFTCTTSAQGVQKDSLFRIISKISNPIKKINRFNEEIENMWKVGDYFRGLEFAKYTLTLSQKEKYLLGIATTLSNQGIIYDYLGRYPEAINIYFQALKIQLSIHNEEEIAKTYNNLGLIYENQNNLNKSLEYYYKSLEIVKRTNNLHYVSVELNNIGIIYMHQKKFNLALKNLFHCVDYAKKVNDQNSLADSYNNIGLVYLKSKEYVLAEIYFLKAFKIREEKNDRPNICNSYMNIASLAYKKNDFQKSNLYYSKALQIALQIGLKKSIEYCYKSLSDISNITNDKLNELKYFKLYIIYKDSISNESNSINQAQNEMQFEFDKKIAEEKIQDQKKDLTAKSNQDKQKIILWAVILVGISTLIFSLFSYKRMLKAKLQNKIIEEQKAIVEQKNHEILDSITYAKRIQSAILPPERLVKEYLVNSFILYNPKDIVAGDFYWIEPTKNQIIFAVADCTGHGVPGAMVSVVCHNALNRAVREYGITDPGLILDKTREIIISEFEKSDENLTDGMDISLCNLDLNTNELKWSGANNPLWLLKKGEKEITEIKPNKQPIGKYYTYSSFQTHTIKVEKGDSLYLFTDGFADQFGGEYEKKFKPKQMREMIVEINHESMSSQRRIFEETFQRWKGNQEQVDDVCVIGILID